MEKSAIICQDMNLEGPSTDSILPLGKSHGHKETLQRGSDTPEDQELVFGTFQNLKG